LPGRPANIAGRGLYGVASVFFEIPPAFHNEASFTIFVGIVLFTASNALSPFSALQVALQRMDIINKISIAVSVPSILGTIYFLENGYGLRGLMLNNAIIFVITSVINIIISFKILPGLKVNILRFDKSMFHKLFAFGCRVQLARISGVVTTQTDKFLIVYFLGVRPGYLLSAWQQYNLFCYFYMRALGICVDAGFYRDRGQGPT